MTPCLVMTNQYTQSEIEQMESSTLFDIQQELGKYIKELYDMPISDAEYWSSYHLLNTELQKVERELRNRRLI